jgi:hypothetical protein
VPSCLQENCAVFSGKCGTGILGYILSQSYPVIYRASILRGTGLLPSRVLNALHIFAFDIFDPFAQELNDG